jgi:hypothetical protein
LVWAKEIRWAPFALFKHLVLLLLITVSLEHGMLAVPHTGCTPNRYFEYNSLTPLLLG